MTEQTWFAPAPKGGVAYVHMMLEFLGPRLSRRKQVLLACNSFYLHRKPDAVEMPWELPAREVADRFVDGKASADELDSVRAAIQRDLDADPYPNDVFHNTLPDAGTQALNLLKLASGQINSLSEGSPGQFYGSPFPFYDKDDESSVEAQLVRDVAGNPFEPVAIDPAWRTAEVRALVQAIYDDRAFERMPVLADALAAAGCDNAAILDHCRSPGPHIRGCWVVDLVLGKK
jgi:hypothetical protein